MPEQNKSSSSGKTYTKKEAQVSDVQLVSPHGAKITVPKRRADALLARQPLDLPNGERKGYKLASESVEKSESPKQSPGGQRA